MNPRITGILFLLAAALGAFVWFYEIEGEEGRKAEEEKAKRLFPDAEAGAVEWIALSTSDGHAARVERAEGGWRLVAPLEFRADAFAVDAMASALAQLASESRYENPQPPEVYGLGAGAREIRFGLAGKEQSVRIGAKAPMGGNTYVSIGGSDDVHAVKTYQTSALGKRLDDLRDKRILDFVTDAVRGLSVRWPEGGVVVRREGEEWRLIEPAAGRADASTVDSALSNLSFLRASGFEDEPPPDSESGLDRPELQVELELAPEKEGSEARRLVLAFGKALASGDRLVRGSGSALFRVPGSRLDDYPRKFVAWRFKDLARFSADDARRLELSFRDDAGAPVVVTATRGEGETWSSAPEAIDPERIRTLVDELARLRARDILADSMGAEELRALSLEPPNARIVVRGADESATLAEVRIGTAREGGGLAAQAAGNPTVFELDPVIGEYVPVSLEAFRQRFVEKPEETAREAGSGAEGAEAEGAEAEGEGAEDEEASAGADAPAEAPVEESP
jgi:hypothetical protein